MNRIAWRRSEATPGERRRRPVRNRFLPVFWLAGALLIFTLLFFTSHVALLSLPAYGGMDMRSQLVADYGIWEQLVFQPVDPAILKEIQQDRGLPGQLVIDESNGSTPTAIVISPSPTQNDVDPTPQPALETPTISPTDSPPTYASTPIPTSTISDPQSTLSPQSSPAPLPTKTRKTPKPKTPKPDRPPKP